VGGPPARIETEEVDGIAPGAPVGDAIVCHRTEIDLERARGRCSAVEALLAGLEARDGYTKDHCEAVLELTSATAHSLHLPSEEVEFVEQVALLHDLGKMAMPPSLLRKCDGLTAEEWDLMREHSAIGARIVGTLPSLRHLAPAVRAAHERWDGRGYPDGLAGERIPLASRIVFVCDSYDAMVSPRPYRDALGRAPARMEIAAAAGSQFCPRAVEALLDAV
jgi:two-component system cell cycle response regulator